MGSTAEGGIPRNRFQTQRRRVLIGIGGVSKPVWIRIKMPFPLLSSKEKSRARAPNAPLRLTRVYERIFAVLPVRYPPFNYSASSARPRCGVWPRVPLGATFPSKPGTPPHTSLGPPSPGASQKEPGRWGEEGGGGPPPFGKKVSTFLGFWARKARETRVAGWVRVVV